MRFGPGLDFFALILFLIALGLPIWATVVTLRAVHLTLTQRLLFLILAWVVGFVGPILTIVLVKNVEENPQEYQ